MTDRELAAKIRKLPVREAAKGAPYVVCTPYRHPPEACSTGKHSIPSIEVVIVTDAKDLRFWEIDLHEVEVHGGSFTPEERDLLERLRVAE